MENVRSIVLARRAAGLLTAGMQRAEANQPAAGRSACLLAVKASDTIEQTSYTHLQLRTCRSSLQIRDAYCRKSIASVAVYVSRRRLHLSGLAGHYCIPNDFFRCRRKYGDSNNLAENYDDGFACSIRTHAQHRCVINKMPFVFGISIFPIFNKNIRFHIPIR